VQFPRCEPELHGRLPAASLDLRQVEYPAPASTRLRQQLADFLKPTILTCMGRAVFFVPVVISGKESFLTCGSARFSPLYASRRGDEIFSGEAPDQLFSSKPLF